jgi:putative endonuclease
VPFVYILRCADGSLYTGSAVDLARRVAAHQAGVASKYTRSRRPVTLAWSRRVRDWRRALRIEWHIKRLERSEKQAIVDGDRAVPRLPRRA